MRAKPGSSSLRARAQQPARLALAGERAVETAERLDPDEVAQHEHVERDLQARSCVDLLRRVRRAARLVVLHDPARAERLEVDAVDLSGERQTVAEVEPAEASSARGRTTPRTGSGRAAARRASTRTNASRSRHSVWSSSCRWSSVSSMRTPATARSRQRRRNGSARSSVRLVEALDAELLRDAAEELVQCVVRDRAAQLRVDLGVDRPRVEQPVDEPRGRAVGEALELGHVEARPLAEVLEHERMRERASAGRTRQRAVEAPLPAVRERERARVARRRRPRARRAPAAARARSAPRRSATSAPTAAAASSRGARRRRRRAARPRPRTGSARAACPRRSPPRARGRAAAWRACTRCRRGSGRARPGPGFTSRAPASVAARVVVEERRAGAAAGQASLLEPEHEDDLEAARARAQQVEHARRAPARGRRRRGPSRAPAQPTISSAVERSAELDATPRARRASGATASNARRSARAASSPTAEPARPCACASIRAAARAALRAASPPRAAP